VGLINTIMKREFKGDKKSRGQFEARIREGYTIEDFTKAITAASKDPYHVKEQYRYLTPELLSREDKLQRFMNMAPPTTAELAKADPRMLGYTIEQIVGNDVREEDKPRLQASGIREELLTRRDNGK
jgi:uncharacterized phage protein (TIGR02220 family)